MDYRTRVLCCAVALSLAPVSFAHASPVTLPGCGSASGTLFNLEPRPDAVAQIAHSVDLLRGRVSPTVDLVVGGATDRREPFIFNPRSGYFVNRDAKCAPEFEGILPIRPVDPEEDLLEKIRSSAPTVVADPARDAFFAVDTRFSHVLGLGLFRTTGAMLLDPAACPNGTHSAAQAATCWPVVRELSVPGLDVVGESQAHLAVDEHTIGTGAGTVYVVVTQDPRPQDGTGGDEFPGNKVYLTTW